MKVEIVGSGFEINAIRRAVSQEFVTLDNGNPDLRLLGRGDESNESKVPSFRVGSFALPKTVVEGTYLEQTTEHFVTRLWINDSWSEQLIVGMPTFGLLNRDLGKQVSSAVMTRYTANQSFGQLFEEAKLTPVLKELGYRGFVSICLCESGITEFWLGVPFNGLFNILEGVRGKLSDWFKEPKLLQESWVVGILISRYPYPFELTQDEYSIDGLCPQMERHFWLFDPTVRRKVTYSVSTQIGMMTAWNADPAHAESQIIWSAGKLLIPEIQFRSDVAMSCRDRWRRLRLI